MINQNEYLEVKSAQEKFHQAYDGYYDEHHRFYIDRKGSKTQLDLLDQKLEDVATQRLSTNKALAEGLIHRGWDLLSPIERRIVDISAAGDDILYLGYNHSTRPTATEDVVAHRYNTQEPLDEFKYINDKLAEQVQGVNSYRGLLLFHLELGATAIYGGRNIKQGEDLGDQRFAIQRSLKIILPNLMPRLLRRVPEGYQRNQEQIKDYLTDVVTEGRTRLDKDGIELTVNPHLKEPYTDQEWDEGLQTAMEIVDQVADRVASSSDGIVAVTSYGPLTRRNKNFIMFHPRTAIQLGAWFKSDEPGVVGSALEVITEFNHKYGNIIKAGTSHGGMFGGSFSGWFRCNTESIQKLDKDLAESPDSLFTNLTIDQLNELSIQLLHGDPLAVNDKKAFTRVRMKLADMEAKHLQPIWDRTTLLHNHMNSGYPTPVNFQQTEVENRQRNIL